MNKNSVISSLANFPSRGTLEIVFLLGVGFYAFGGGMVAAFGIFMTSTEYCGAQRYHWAVFASSLLSVAGAIIFGVRLIRLVRTAKQPETIAQQD